MGINMKKILIVDDDFINQELLAATLEGYNLESVVVDSGAKALRFIMNTHGIDLIFMDLNMPGMSGMEATVAIREYELSAKLPRVPIIAASASIDREDTPALFASGMDDIITKPIMSEDLERILNFFIFQSNAFHYDMTQASKKLNISQEAMKNYIQKCASALEDELPLIKEIALKKDYKELRELAHKLKGRTGNLQIMSMFDLFSRIEKSAKEHEECDYVSLINQLIEFNGELKKL